MAEEQSTTTVIYPDEAAFRRIAEMVKQVEREPRENTPRRRHIPVLGR